MVGSLLDLPKIHSASNPNHKANQVIPYHRIALKIQRTADHQHQETRFYLFHEYATKQNQCQRVSLGRKQ
jgi:hypothetical protein